MSVWHIKGENSLQGSIRVQGAKNAALPILAATVAVPCEAELLNVPSLRDVAVTERILRHTGSLVTREGDVMSVDTRALTQASVPAELMREMRSSVIFLGALLARCGEARVYMPGGCELGPRPIDLHLMALRALGAEIEVSGGEISARAAKLRGTVIEFPSPSVGATENAMLAACAAEGVTTIRNAAREPEIVDLARFLRALGAKVQGAGSSQISIEGMEARPAVGHRIMADRIAASTYLCAAAAAGGDVELRGAEPQELDSLICALGEAGCVITGGRESLRIRSKARLHAPELIVTGPYPEFATDAQPLLLAACLKANGSSVFVENVFGNRYRFVEELKKLGALVHIEGRVAVVTGVPKLRGAETRATDLRGGAALVIAGLCAEGETTIRDEGHITRGYENFAEQLRALGARVSTEE